MTVTIEQASAQLAQLIEKAASGEEIIIYDDATQAMRLVPLETPAEEPVETLKPRVPGLGKGQMWMAPDFDGSMPDDWLDEFYNGEIFPCNG